MRRELEVVQWASQFSSNLYSVTTEFAWQASVKIGLCDRPVNRSQLGDTYRLRSRHDISKSNGRKCDKDEIQRRAKIPSL